MTKWRFFGISILALTIGMVQSIQVDKDQRMISVEPPKEKLIFDIGMNRGEDTAAYLDMGLNVVALEGNPIRVEKNMQDKALNLQKFIDEGRLTVLNNVVDKTSDESMSFYVPKLKDGAYSILTFLEGAQMLKDEWMFTDEEGRKMSKLKHLDEVASADRQNACNSSLPCSDEHPICSCEEREVKSVSCKDLINQYGIPHYLKVDIEGYDGHCMNSLMELPCSKMPPYISFEEQSIHPMSVASAKEMMSTLSKKGYVWKVSRQPIDDHAKLGTGPYGEEVSDYVHGKSWGSKEDVQDQASINCWDFGGKALPKYDCDVHGKFVATKCQE